MGFTLSPWLWLAIYLMVVSGLGFAEFGIDKYRAKRRKWRIPERTLFLTAVLGGSLGCILGMQVFRHKTKHKSFTFGMPLILVLQVILLAVLRSFA